MVVRSPGFFDVDGRLAELSAKGDGLERVKALVDCKRSSEALAIVCAQTWEHR